MTDLASAVQRLAELINLPTEAVAISYRMVRQALDRHHRQYHPNMPAEAYLRLAFADGKGRALVASAAFRLLHRDEDAARVEAVQAAAHPKPGTPRTRPTAGCAPEDADHPDVQAAVAVLVAAGLPPIETPRGDGFQVLPAGPDLLGWVFIARDSRCAERTGFAGGANGYERVMHFAGWDTSVEPDTGLLAACPPNSFGNALAAIGSTPLG